MLRTSALNIISELNITGGCNVQYALHPETFEYCVNRGKPACQPFFWRWLPSDRISDREVAAKIALGYTLDEIKKCDHTEDICKL